MAIDVKGKSVSDLFDIDINRLDKKDLAQVVSRIASAGNKRLRRLEKSGKASRAAERVEETGGKFSVAGKNLNELRQEWLREKQFFESATSSLTGIRDVTRRTAATLEERGVKNVDRDSIGDTFKLYDRLKEIDPTIASRGMKYAVINEINNLPDDMDYEDKILAMQDRITELYEEQEALEDEFTGVSEFFDI